MKELYEDMKIEVIIFDAADIIATSDLGGEGAGGTIDGGGSID